MDFGDAIRAIKDGKLVRRAGWNGKGMHVYLEDWGRSEIKAGAFKGATRTYEPVVCLFNATGNHQPGWNASQADMLADDWELVE